VRYQTRYGSYPPDEVEVFTKAGLPGSSTGGSLLPGGAKFIPAPASGTPPYPAMEFYQAGNPAAGLEHRDLAALIIAIEELAPKAAAILQKIPDSRWSAGILDPSGKPVQFLDRNDNGTWDPSVDTQVRLVIDDWGNPFSYFAQRDFDADDPSATNSSNAEGWNQTSTELIRLNKGVPLLVSYGANGTEQLRKDAQTAEDATASMVSDWMDPDDPGHRINDPYNTDNVYLDPTLTERLSQGIAGGP
jgi:hypothetical protein